MFLKLLVLLLSAPFIVSGIVFSLMYPLFGVFMVLMIAAAVALGDV